MCQSLFLELTCLRVHKSNLLKARVIITTYNDHVRLLPPEPWLVCTTKAYSGLGADIVMESISLKSPNRRVISRFYRDFSPARLTTLPKSTINLRDSNMQNVLDHIALFVLGDS